MTKIVISYRRRDSELIAGRICDKLTLHYGTNSVFMDIDSIPFGVDFREHIESVLTDADAVVAIIGPKWVGARKNQKIRLHVPEDPVRVELEKAFELRIPVVPVLVDGAEMPDHERLPASLRDLSFRNAAVVDAGRDFHQHMDRLIRSLDRLLPNDTRTDAQAGAEQAANAVPRSFGKRVGHLKLALVLVGAVVAAGGIALLALRNDVPRSTPTVPAGAATPISCDEERNLRSLSTTAPTSIFFRNIGDKTVRLYWLDHSGSRKLYATLQRDQMVNLQTYITHPWVITDTSDRCVGIYMPAASRLEINIRI